MGIGECGVGRKGLRVEVLNYNGFEKCQQNGNKSASQAKRYYIFVLTNGTGIYASFFSNRAIRS